MKFLITMLAIGAVALAQDTGDRISVPFSDPSRPKTVRGSLINGCFAVEGYDGNEVQVETRGGEGGPQRTRVPRGAEGLKRLESTSFGLTVEEENNTVRIHGPASRTVHVVLRVPRSTTLKLECTNSGDMEVTGVSGDLELNNLNGGITATNVSGSVLAHSLNGKVRAILDRVTPDKPMSFSTLNGDIDVTIPADTKATLKMKSDNGEIFTDFEVRLSPNSAKTTVEDGRGSGGKYKVKVDKSTVGTINGGGPEMTFKTLNGSIFLRQKK